ncbi:MAG: laccase domain-containing protein, partial [Candidatus Omnitrophica bacterium]|nr:laccase domain-containing protein [Candidatus Omnitrophota bacterium]
MPIFNPLKIGLENVVAAFSRRQDGNMSLSYGDTHDSLANRKKFLFGLGIDYQRLVCAKQVHGKKIEYVTANNAGSGALDYDSSVADTDGFITDQKNVPIAILTADCLSIFIYDPKRPAIAILHAGWRSTEQNISEAAIKAMQDRFASQPEKLLIGFG